MNQFKTKKWRQVLKGDIVDIVAPGWSIPRDHLEAALKFLKSWGLKPRVPKDLYGEHFLFSQDESIRLRHLKEALQAKDSKIIWCVRGGYGCNHLLPGLMKLDSRKFNPKLLIGISDITSLHIFFNQSLKWPTLHGPLLDRLGQSKVPPEIEQELKSIIFGDKVETIFSGLRPLNSVAFNLKRLTSQIVGGNLIVCQSGIGTPSEIRLKNRLLFIEDVGERGYRIDRALEQLDQAGQLSVCKGVLIGQFLLDQEPQGKTATTPQVFQDWADRLEKRNIPVFSGIEAGHGIWQWPLPFGTACVLENLTIQESKKGRSGSRFNFQLKVSCGL